MLFQTCEIFFHPWNTKGDVLKKIHAALFHTTKAYVIRCITKNIINFVLNLRHYPLKTYFKYTAHTLLFGVTDRKFGTMQV